MVVLTATKYTKDEDTYDSCYTKNFLNDINYEVNKLNDDNLLNKQYSLTNISLYKKYKSINYLLGVIILLCIIVIILTALNKNVEYFDNTSYVIIISIVLALGIVYIVRLFFDIMSRSNINYDEYLYTKYNNIDTSSFSKTENKGYVTSDISFCNI
jgi:hypothetical protein